MSTLLHQKSKRVVTGVVRSGRRTDIMTVGSQGRYLKSRPPKTSGVTDIAILPTIKAAIMHSQGGKIEVKKRDYREKVRRRKISTLICMVLDASSSMVMDAKMKGIKDALGELMLDAYQKRDRISLVSCYGRTAEVVLPFTSSIDKGKQYIERLEFGGTTPLAMGMRQGLDNLRAKLRIEKDTNPLLIIVTDGSANMPIVPGEDIEKEVKDTCVAIERAHIPTLIIDVSKKGSKLASEMANLCGGVYHHLEHGEVIETPVRIEDVMAFDKTLEYVSIGLVDPNFKGAVFQASSKEIVREVLEFVDSLSLEFRAIGDCPVGCDPSDKDAYCNYCRMKYLDADQPPEIKTSLRTFPIIQLDKENTSAEMMGDIYIRFLATTSKLKEANRGILFVENIDLLNKDVAKVLAKSLTDRSYTLKKNGRTMTFPCKFSVVGTLSQDGANVQKELEDQITLFVKSTKDDDLHYRTKLIQYGKEYDTDPANFRTKLDKFRKEWMINYLKARKVMQDIQINEILNKALDHYSTELSQEVCFPDKLKGLAKVIAAKNYSTQVGESEAAEAISIMKKHFKSMAKMEMDIPPILKPFVGIAQAVAEAEVLKDKILLLLVSMEDMGGALIRGFDPDSVRSALRYLQEMEFTIDVVKGCTVGCDPSRPEELCPRCRLDYEYDRMTIEKQKLPVVFLPKNVMLEGLRGSVFVNYVVRPSLLTRAHRGIMFVENIEELEHDVETALASALATGKNSVERDGIVIEQPCRILLVATMEDREAEIHPLISDKLGILLEATPEDQVLIRVKALCYLEEFGSRPELFNSKILESKELAINSVLGGQKLMPEVTISDAQLDLIARMCAEFNVEGNSSEF
ncbi:MAG: VWA domain-containing protein, partial [Thermoplasmata archaeon]|nr:VWA domain-containing protein [Thermoplasmata archaeon]